MFCIILAASLTLLSLDLLLIEMEDSNSALMVNRVVLFLSFLFSHINSKPVAKIETDASMKGSSEVNSSLRALSSFWHMTGHNSAEIDHSPCSFGIGRTGVCRFLPHQNHTHTEVIHVGLGGGSFPC